MAYGKSKDRKNWLMRAVPLGVGALPAGKRAALMELRNRVLALMRQMAVAGFNPEPLAHALRGKELDAALLAVQGACEGLNSVWREQARMRVTPALEEAVKRYFKRMVGRLRFVDTLIPTADQREGDPRRYYHVPPEVQDAVTADELAALKAMGESGPAIDLFRRVIVARNTDGLSPAQAAIVVDIHARCLAKHTLPDFGATDDFTLQLHIDSRMLPSGRQAEALDVRNGVAFLLADDANAQYHRFLDLAGVAPREGRLRIPLVLTPAIARRIASSRDDWAALIVELSAHHVGVRLVCGKPPPADIDTSAITCLVGRDYGYANTVALSVAIADAPIDLTTERIRAEGREAAQAFFEAHALPAGVRIVERVRLEGRAFLARLATLCGRIDGYKSRIDLAYNRLDALRHEIAAALDLAPEDRITPEMKKCGPAGAQVRAFFHTWGLIQDLKAARRRLYAKVAAVKKNWFGYVSNVEIALAQKYNAALVREDLTVAAIEKEAPRYKGRSFNKMLNNGSKGQYQRRASDKLLWNGIPEVDVPSWYTSRACTTHSAIIDRKHRNGERIYLPCCGRHEHADEHASDTIATYLFLRSRLTRPLTRDPGS